MAHVDGSKNQGQGEYGAFVGRHIGIRSHQIDGMLRTIGVGSLDQLIDRTVPSNIRIKSKLNLPKAASEPEALAQLKEYASKNTVAKSYIGAGYYNTFVPAVIQRNILENPGWYTQYTPYQAEIAQGRLEALLNFQTLICELTGLDVANASLLDEATAAAEAMVMTFSSKSDDASVFAVSNRCHKQVIDVVKTRAMPLGIEVSVCDVTALQPSPKIFGILLQYPDTEGAVDLQIKDMIAKFKSVGAQVILAADPLALVCLQSPGALGADIAVGSAQRFGVPLGFGGPHAGFMACKDEHKRRMPGRIVGISKDKDGNPAIRLALQTREQHIRREKATSNICTAQVLLAVMASMYAVYHGPEGLSAIANGVHDRAARLANGLKAKGLKVKHDHFFDTVAIVIDESKKAEIIKKAKNQNLRLRTDLPQTIAVSLDETTSDHDVATLISVLAGITQAEAQNLLAAQKPTAMASSIARDQRSFLKQPIFNKYRSETEMMRYIRSLEAKDLSLTSSMIPLGSCTMKLNAASELYPITWEGFNSIHPFAPKEDFQGYQQLFTDLEQWLAEVTGFAAISLQPNSGSQGEYAGLLVIQAYHKSRGDSHRNVCLIPQSAHGTNPASAALAGMKIVAVACDQLGNVDVADLKKKAQENAKELSCLMITYPSTHGVFEEQVSEICHVIHDCGGQVYMDGANMNAQVGLCRPGDIGADVCHLNLHKTFCIPHGGGGPGMGPIGVAKHLENYLPGHSLQDLKHAKASGAVSAAPYGSASILPISWMYIRMMGESGLTQATKIAILNANYMAKRLDPHFPVLYKGKNGTVAHECIVDLRPFKAATGIEVEDVAKRLMDYGFHAPTVSFPVAGTLMIEPTESEDLQEIDRFCDAMIAIREEIAKVEKGTWPKDNNPLKNAPHTAKTLVAETWSKPYARELAVFPSEWTKTRKFWPPVARIDSAYGDRNLVCTCDDMSSYALQ
jgi:glycine dehydrogenase